MIAPPTIFIVDDDAACLEATAALARTLSAGIETFESAEPFLAGFDPARRGCLVADVRMPGRSGLELIAELQRRDSRLPVIIMTAYGDIPMAVGAMRSGALTFLPKPCRDHDLWEAMRDALALDEQNHEQARRLAGIEAKLASLSDEERQVLDLMLEDVPCKAIAKRMSIGMRTAQARRAAVFQKMSADSLPQLALMVHRLEAAERAQAARLRSA